MPTQNYTNETFATPDPSNSCVVTLGTQEPMSTMVNCDVIGGKARWGLKMPENIGSLVSQTRLSGGIKRALDMVHCKGQSFLNCVFASGPDRKPTTSKFSLSETCDAGIKGGSKDITFEGCTITDLLLGDHTIYDNPNILPKTRGIVIKDCVHPNGPGTPIIIRCLNAEKPTLINTNAVVLAYPRWVVLAYFWFSSHFIDTRKGVLPSNWTNSS